MDTWFFGHYDTEETGEIFVRFSQYRFEARSHDDMALFERLNKENGATTLYFSPWSHEIAKEFKAVKCDNPHREKLRLVRGDQKAWEILFSH